MLLLFWKEAATGDVTVTPGAGEVLINGNQPAITALGGAAASVAAGASEVLIEGTLTVVTVNVAPVVTVARADTYGGGLYDRSLELQAEDELILQVIQAFLKKAA